MNSGFKWIGLSLMAATLFLSGCSGAGGDNKPQNNQNVMAKLAQGNHDHYSTQVKNAKMTIPWAGTYQGIFPCAGCEGVATMLQLKPDNTFFIRTRMLGKEEIDKKASGTIEWFKENSYIRLVGGNTQNRVFRVGQDVLELVLPDGQEIPAKKNNPDAYFLKKDEE